MDVYCVGCANHKTLGVKRDPRVPPLAEGLCLCAVCYKVAVADRIDDLVDEINLRRAEMDSLAGELDACG